MRLARVTLSLLIDQLRARHGRPAGGGLAGEDDVWQAPVSTRPSLGDFHRSNRSVRSLALIISRSEHKSIHSMSSPDLRTKTLRKIFLPFLLYLQLIK